MTTTITRLYASQADAEAAVKTLKDEMHQDRDISMIAGTPPSEDAESTASADSYIGAIKSAGVYDAAAKIYADHVAGGKALVVYRAPFGRARSAGVLMDSCNPVETDVKYTAVYDRGRDIGTVRSPSGQVNVLRDTLILSSGRKKKSNPTPFSSALRLPVLSTYKKKSSSLKAHKPILGMKTVIRPSGKLSVTRSGRTLLIETISR